MKEKGNILVGFCPECDTRIRFHTLPRLGQLITCRECNEICEVVSLHPIELDWAYAEEHNTGYDRKFTSR
jgi:lysine biosynthesis protein LysW